MRHGFVMEPAYNVNQRVNCSHGCQCHVLSLTSYQSLNVDELDGGVCGFLGVENRRKVVQTGVRHFDYADIRLESPAPTCGHCRPPLRQDVENRRFANRCHSDNSSLHTNTKLAQPDPYLFG